MSMFSRELNRCFDEKSSSFTSLVLVQTKYPRNRAFYQVRVEDSWAESSGKVSEFKTRKEADAGFKKACKQRGFAVLGK